jgi:3-dehydroquinate synthase
MFTNPFKTLTQKVRLRTWHDNSYRILIQPGLLHRIPEDLQKGGWGKKYCIISDNHVRKLYGEELAKALRAQGLDATLISFQSGESHKRLATIEKLAEQMVQLGHNRTSCILALGGGVVGDMAGFLASVYMRGIPFLQIPTTLIAMADSSIGGKTGVDLKLGKNLLGTFAQPKKIYIDPQLLSTLSVRQIQNGLAEILKHGLLADKKILKLLEKYPDRAQNAHTTTMTALLERSCQVKVDIVERDEREQHKRMLLNYGHTIGHAIEHASGYRLGHGQAVAIGMNLENRLAVDRGLQKVKMCEHIEQVIEALGLPTSIPEKIDRTPILKALAYDKKHRGKGYTFTLLKRPGRPKIIEGITESEVKAVL